MIEQPERYEMPPENNRLSRLSQARDVILPNKQHLRDFLNNYKPNDTVWVFDFDGTIIHKGFNSFSPIDRSEKDTNGEMLAMKAYMLCILDAQNYNELNSLLKERNVTLPENVYKLTTTLSFQQFKAKQLNHWRKHSFEKAIERELPMDGFDLTELTFRPGAIELLNSLLDQKHQVLIITSGVENVVSAALEHAGYDLSHPSLHIKGNRLYLDTAGNAKSFDPDMITPYTKKHIDYHKYGISEKSFAIQAGDSEGDNEMVSDHFAEKDIVSIGFANSDRSKINTFTRLFDTIHTDEESSFEPVHKAFL